MKLNDNAATILAAAFRLVNRLKLSQNIVDDFKENALEFMALHWDGKLTINSYGNTFETLSVLVSGPPTHSKGKLLGMQPLSKVTGKAQLELSSELLKERSIVVMEELKALINDKKVANSVPKTHFLYLVMLLLVFHYGPGATADARWMGQVLYCSKMFMWFNQV